MATEAHYHCWFLADGGRIWYASAKAYASRATANDAAARREPDPRYRMVRRCDVRACDCPSSRAAESAREAREARSAMRGLAAVLNR